MKNKTNDLDLTKGNIRSNLLSLAWPIIIGMLIQTAFNIVDTIFIGMLGPEPLAAMSMAFPVLFFVMSLAAGSGVGVNSLVSRYLGAKRKKEADNVAEHGILIIIILSVFFTIFGLLFSESIFKLLGASDELLAMILEYTNVFFIGSFTLFLTFICNNILRAEGDAKTPMKVMALSGILNIILDPIMIFGLAFIPAMGIKGAALATILSRLVASIYVINHLLIKKKSHLAFDLADFKFKWILIRKIYIVGFPASMSQMVMSLGLFVFNFMIIKFGTVALAAFGIMFRLESLVFMPLMGLTTAVITIVGHNYGAKKYDRVDKTLWSASSIGSIFVIIMAILFIIFPGFWISIFIKDPAVLDIGKLFLQITPIGYILLAPSLMILGTFQGLGKGFFPMIYHVIRLFFLALPIAYLLTFILDWGVSGIMWSFVFSSISVEIIAILYYYFGPWRKKTFHIDD